MIIFIIAIIIIISSINIINLHVENITTSSE